MDRLSGSVAVTVTSTAPLPRALKVRLLPLVRTRTTLWSVDTAE